VATSRDKGRNSTAVIIREVSGLIGRCQRGQGLAEFHRSLPGNHARGFQRTSLIERSHPLPGLLHPRSPLVAVRVTKVVPQLEAVELHGVDTASTTGAGQHIHERFTHLHRLARPLHPVFPLVGSFLPARPNLPNKAVCPDVGFRLISQRTKLDPGAFDLVEDL
jgi:hypothetical protein